MPAMSLWSQLFLQCFGSAFMLPLASPSAFFAMAGFGGYDMKTATALAVTAAMAAQALNFALGRFLLHLRSRGQIYVREDIYVRGHWLASSWLLPLLLFTWVGLGALLTLLAGFFNVPVRRAFPVLLLGWVAYYAYCGFFR